MGAVAQCSCAFKPPSAASLIIMVKNIHAGVIIPMETLHCLIFSALCYTLSSLSIYARIPEIKAFNAS